VGNPAGDVEQIDGAVAEYLVGNVDRATPRVAHLRSLHDEKSFIHALTKAWSKLRRSIGSGTGGTKEMEPRIDVITLAVHDLDRALAFYRDGLGLESPGVIGTEFTRDDTNPSGAAAMFQLRGGLTLALYSRTDLEKDANVSFGPSRTGEFSIGHAVGSRADVDALLAQAEAAGATRTDQPHERPWGIYSGYFRDLDGHLWEIIWNPQLDGERG
jgi:hypothetical protein